MKQSRVLLLAVALCAVPGLAFGQSYTANFVSTPPTIDGEVAAGEWDAAEPAMGADWTDHGSGAAADTNEMTEVRVLYSVDGLYVLYECTDTDVLSVVLGSERGNGTPEGTPGRQPSGEMGWTFGGTDYLAIYLDPANVADDAAIIDPSAYSYSLQAEPSMTANGESDDMGNSYNYSEFGRFGGFRVRNDPPVEVDGVTYYWFTGGAWDIEGTKIADAASADGYVMEFFIPWSDLDLPYYQYVGSAIVDNFIDLDAADANIRTFEDSVWGLAAVDGGDATGMPLPGTVWKAQFCRHSASAEPAYTNWVGDTAQFVSRPFGDLVFGEAPVTAVKEAFQHLR